LVDAARVRPGLTALRWSVRPVPLMAPVFVRALLALSVVLTLLICAVAPANAQMPGQTIAAPPAQSATQKEVPLDSAFRDKLVEPGQMRATGSIEKTLDGLPTFLRDTNLTF